MLSPLNTKTYQFVALVDKQINLAICGYEKMSILFKNVKESKIIKLFNDELYDRHFKKNFNSNKLNFFIIL